MKTIFVTIGTGLAARNIVTSGVLAMIAKRADCRVVALIHDAGNTKPPADLLHGIEGGNIILEFVPNFRRSKAEELMHRVATYLPFTISTKILLRYNGNVDKRLSPFMYGLYWLFYTPLSRLAFLKRALRVFDKAFFKTTHFDKYFDTYKPDLVFSTSSISSTFDLPVLREAKQRDIKTVAMTKSWDNLDKIFFRVKPDIFLVQGELMKDAVVKYQALPADTVRVVGFPQFDMYKNRNLIMSREAYAKKKGFDPALPILFLGSEGMWTCLNDEEIFASIIKARDTGMLPPCNILIRPHFSALLLSDYSKLAKSKNVFIDDTFHREPFFIDNWNPTEEDMVDFMNSLYHMDVMLMFASTLALDAACFDKPIIGVGYGTLFDHGRDVSRVRYQTTHFKWVMDAGVIAMAYSPEELIESIKKALAHPEEKSEQRKRLLGTLCHGADGRSGEYIAEEIASLLSRV